MQIVDLVVEAAESLRRFFSVEDEIEWLFGLGEGVGMVGWLMIIYYAALGLRSTMSFELHVKGYRLWLWQDERREWRESSFVLL